MSNFLSQLSQGCQTFVGKTLASAVELTNHFDSHPVIQASSHPLTELFQACLTNQMYDQVRFQKKTPKLFSKLCDMQATGENCNLVLQKKIAKLANEVLFSLSLKDKNNVYGTVYHLVRPITNDLNWGENHATDDTLSLIKALDHHGHLERPARYCKIWLSFENGFSTPSTTYELNRPLLLKGAVGYINGIATSKDVAIGDAYRFSDDLLNGSNIHGIYNATNSLKADILSTTYLQEGVSTPPVKLLLDQWMRFFHTKNADEKFLQICFSQGAVHVNNALNALEPSLRERICVIAIAPAIFIEPFSNCQVVHFVKNTDVFSLFTKNRLRATESLDIIQVELEEGYHPHDPHSPNYTAKIQPFINKYLNDQPFFN